MKKKVIFILLLSMIFVGCSKAKSLNQYTVKSSVTGKEITANGYYDPNKYEAIFYRDFIIFYYGKYVFLKEDIESLINILKERNE